MTLRLDDQALHIDYPSPGQHIDAPLDSEVVCAAAGRQVRSLLHKASFAAGAGRVQVHSVTPEFADALTPRGARPNIIPVSTSVG